MEYIYWICAEAHTICIYKSWWPGTRHSLHYFEIEKTNEMNEITAKHNVLVWKRSWHCCWIVVIRNKLNICLHSTDATPNEISIPSGYVSHLLASIPAVHSVHGVLVCSRLAPSIFITFYCDLFYFGASRMLLLICAGFFLCSSLHRVRLSAFSIRNFASICLCWRRKKYIYIYVYHSLTEVKKKQRANLDSKYIMNYP